MKERPILFSGPMVRAILEGRKTQTRRIIKPQPKYIEASGRWYWEKALDVNGEPLVDASRKWWEYYGTSPYGKPGDRLWVRETFTPFAADGTPYLYKADEDTESDGRVPYLVSGAGGFGGGVGHAKVDKWRPSIHMPHKSSRITLEITNVRVERLQDISREDALAEGIERIPETSPILTFGRLWEKINYKRGYGWTTNPWVWVIEFKKL